MSRHTLEVICRIFICRIHSSTTVYESTLSLAKMPTVTCGVHVTNRKRGCVYVTRTERACNVRVTRMWRAQRPERL